MTTPLYCGIDLHSNNSVISIQDKSSKQVYEKRLLNDLPTILKALKPYQQDLQGCVVESTYNWYGLVDGLMEAGHGSSFQPCGDTAIQWHQVHQ